MEQLAMQTKRSTALVATMVALVISMALVIGHQVYVNHSTISSLKSELSEKDQIITDKDNLIQQKDAIIDQGSIKVEEKQKEVEEKSQQVEELQKQVSLKLERDQQLKLAKQAQEAMLVGTATVAEKTKKVMILSTSNPQESKSQFQDGWKATFYSLGVESTGKRPGDRGYGLTASGRRVQDNITIAVDPKQIPLGSWVEIQFPDGHIEKRRADDTGSAIKGRKIDVYVNTTERQLNNLGVQQIKVRVLRGDQAA